MKKYIEKTIDVVIIAGLVATVIGTYYLSFLLKVMVFG